MTCCFSTHYIEGTVTELLEENGITIGVEYKERATGELKVRHRHLTCHMRNTCTESFVSSLGLVRAINFICGQSYPSNQDLYGMVVLPRLPILVKQLHQTEYCPPDLVVRQIHQSAH